MMFSKWDLTLVITVSRLGRLLRETEEGRRVVTLDRLGADGKAVGRLEELGLFCVVFLDCIDGLDPMTNASSLAKFSSCSSMIGTN